MDSQFFLKHAVLVRISNLRIKLFADLASLRQIEGLTSIKIIKGITTNPTLMMNSGVKDYRLFASSLLQIVQDIPISFEVLSENAAEIERQAIVISSWGPNVYVKIPIINSCGEYNCKVLEKLVKRHIKVNVTGVLTLEQVLRARDSMYGINTGFVSIFAGRIADTGRDPVPIITSAKKEIAVIPGLELIWASSREVLNIFQAEAAQCDIITITYPLIQRLHMIDQDLELCSLEVVRNFNEDANKAGLIL